MEFNGLRREKKSILMDTKFVYLIKLINENGSNLMLTSN